MGAATGWAFAGSAVYAGCQWLIFVLLVKTLHPSEVGHFAYAVAVTGPIFVLANVRLRNLLATGVGTPGDFSDYLATRLLTTAAAAATSLVIGAVVVGGVQALGVLALMTSARACDAIADICHGLFQRELDMRSAATGLMTNGILSLALVAMSLALVPSLVAATGAYAAGSLLALVGWDLRRAGQRAILRRLAVRDVTAILAAARALLWRALPLGLSSAIGSVQINLPRYVIAAYLGPAALAAFTALAYVPLLGHLIVNAASQTALPLLARDLQTSRKRYQTRLVVLVTGGITIGVLCLATVAGGGRTALTYLYSVEYADHIGVLLWLMAATTVSFASVFLGTGTTARQRFGAQCLISLTALIVIAGSIGPLVSRYGLMGAAWSLLAGAVVEVCAYIVLTIRDLRDPTPLRCTAPAGWVGGIQS